MKSITKNFLCLALSAALSVSLLPSSFATDESNPEQSPAPSSVVSEEPTVTSANTEVQSEQGSETSANPTPVPDASSDVEQPDSNAPADSTLAPESSPDAGQADTGDGTVDPVASPSADGDDTTTDENSSETAVLEEETEKEEDKDSSFCLYVIDASAQAESDSITFASERQDEGYYPTFADALAFALDGDTITICDNTSVTYNKPIEKSITIDMAYNGFIGPLICAADKLVVIDGFISAGDDAEASDDEVEEPGADESEAEEPDVEEPDEESGAEDPDDDENVKYAVINQEGCSLTLANCDVTGPLSGAFALTDGTYSVEPQGNQIASGYYTLESSEGVYTVLRGIACTGITGEQSLLKPIFDYDGTINLKDLESYAVVEVDDASLIIDYNGTLNLEDLESFSFNNGVTSIQIHSNMAAKALPSEDLLTEEEKADNDISIDDDSADDSGESSEPAASPNTVITDDSGDVFFSSVANGGSLKLTDTSNTDKSTLRFQYTFVVPVDPEDLTWSWKIYYYNEAKGKNYSLTVRGIKYFSKDDGSIISNAIITNIPSSVYTTDLKAVLTLSFEHNGLSYTVTQNLPYATSVTQSTPEIRSIHAVAAHLYNSADDDNDYIDYYYSIATKS